MEETKFWCRGSSFKKLLDLDLNPHQCGDMRNLFFVIKPKLPNSQMICPLKIYPVPHFMRGGGSGWGEPVQVLLGEDTFLR